MWVFMKASYMNTKRLQDKLNKYGLIIIGEYKDLKHIPVKDKNGYKYKISLQNLEKGRNPRKFSWNTNYSNCFYNINVFIKNNNLANQVIEVYNNRKAKFICECGNEFTTDVYRFINDKKEDVIFVLKRFLA